MSVLHFVPDQDDPRAVIARFRAAMAPGSFLALSHGTVETRPDDPRARLADEVYRQSSAAITLRSLESVYGLFDGFDLVEPGLVWISEWRPNPFEEVRNAGETLRGGVARKAA
jgi:hypothetical protein